MKFAFVTCVQLGLSCIEKIYEIGGKLDLLITLHDHKSKNKSGRVYLDDFSDKNGIELLKINHINDQEVLDKLKLEDIDWVFIIGWSQIASLEFIQVPNKGVLGMHPTLLPEGRGRAAIPWAILKGLSKTGVTMFKLDEGVDTGPILGAYEIPLTSTTTATELYENVNDAHRYLIENVWNELVEDKVRLITQIDKDASYWEGRKPGDGELNSLMTMKDADRLVRATTKPYPGAFILADKRKTIIWAASFQQMVPVDTLNFFKLKDGYLIPTLFDTIELNA